MNRNESIRGMRINDKRSLTGWTEFAERAGRSPIDTLPSPLGNRAAATTKMPQRDIHGFHLSDLWQVPGSIAHWLQHPFGIGVCQPPGGSFRG